MTATIHDVLDELRTSATSEADKGSKFERLMKAFLTTDPVYADQFSDVWMWGEWPGSGGKHDTGIDLVAKDRNTGHHVAIQCKFYAPTSTVGKPQIDSFLSASGKEGFAERIIVSTTDKWNSHAEDALKGQQVPVRRIGMVDLAWSLVDWAHFSLTTPEVMHLAGNKSPRPHQRTAIDKVKAGFADHGRGKLVMACGTGKTFTSLRLAEETVGVGGSVLFLVPSISLLSQTVREWVGERQVDIRALAVCSDAKSTKRSVNTSEDISAVDLALPATTNVDVLVARMDDASKDAKAMTVVFATYQSIDVVARAQKRRGQGFDLIICDEAHRTTGTTLAGEDESAFVRVHDDAYIQGAKRLYMTATPRIFEDSSKAKAGEANAVLCSMDDESIYGPELHRLGFGEAVALDLLTDYKVLVLAVDEEAVARTFQEQLSDSELQLDDAAKIVGCWNGLAKRGLAEHSFEPDDAPMRRAVAFAGNIKDSKRIEDLFTQISDHYVEAHGLTEDGGDPPLACQVQHVDGTFNALERNGRIDWLQRAPAPNSCRILTNARCLSEGVDIPALDAVMFLSPRKSIVDIVQSVGRVMRKAPGKQFGYIVLPIGVPSGMTPEQALRDNKRYAAVWEVLQALRAHDERFDAMVNRIDLTSKRDQKINVIGVGGSRGGESWNQDQLGLAWETLDDLRDAIYSKIVAKVGTRKYWTEWAKSVADIAVRQTTRINALLSDPTTSVANEFDDFLDGLRGNLNEGISQADAVEMLAQHLITRPVFNALFEGYEFLDHNPVAQAMEKMLNALDEHNVDDENRTLERFYDSVRMRVQGIDNAEGRQRIIVELYDTFFATAFKKTVDRLGIVYTPVEIVDFILHSADQVLRAEFGQGLTDEGVHVLDGFVGTGTFITRLLASGLIKPEDLARKYANELHANEILLLAYYIAAVNIETTYQDVMTGHVDGESEYAAFPGLILTDTFQSWEDDDRQDLDVFPENNERLERLKKLPITVIIGNPPYRGLAASTDVDDAGFYYRGLDRRISETYRARSSAATRTSIYDSYVRAFRWAADRLHGRGIVAFVTNNGWLTSNTGDGIRLSFAQEFDAIHVVDLHGNSRSGRNSADEGGNVFNARVGTAIVFLVKQGCDSTGARIRYYSIGSGMTAREKLEHLCTLQLQAEGWADVNPNVAGDWMEHRSADFEHFTAMGGKKERAAGELTIFRHETAGLMTNRDPWIYNFSASSLESHLNAMVAFYESERARFVDARIGNPTLSVDQFLTVDRTQFSWSASDRQNLASGKRLVFIPSSVRKASYRPFARQRVYFRKEVVHSAYRLDDVFPPDASNVGLFVSGPGGSGEFACLMTDGLPDRHFLSTGQLYGRWRFVQDSCSNSGSLVTAGLDSDARVDNISDGSLRHFRAAYGEAITKDDIFFYVYGLLHSPDYREMYAADLKKMLPRIPLVEDARPFIDAGRTLSELHLGYESQTPYPLDGLDVEGTGGEGDYDFFRVEQMRFGKPTTEQKAAGERADRTTIDYNSHIRLAGIPEAAYRYMLGSRSAIEWIIDRYQVKQDKASGIVNDANDWSREVGDPRYVLDLLARIVTVSLESMQVVDGLPVLAIRADQESGTPPRTSSRG